MHGIVSLLDRQHNQKVEELWHELDLDCGLEGVQDAPIAHFSWHIAEGYQNENLRPIMKEIAAASQPFFARTTGIGLFTGKKPVVYISLVKNDLLLRFHKIIWQKVNEFAVNPSPFYTPAAWMPHITLAHAGGEWRSLLCAMEKLAYQPFNWEILVDNLALINQDEGHVGEEAFSFHFGERRR